MMTADTPLRGPLWITGASQGIGRALALHAAQAGMTVAISARSRDKLDAVAAEADSGRVHAYPCDVTDGAAVEETAAAIERDLGPIGTAVLNAGTHAETPVDSFRAADVERIVGLNLFGTATGLEVLMRRMIGRRAGHIAVVASVAGYRGLPRAAAYSASKAAVIALAESLKVELDSRGVTLQVVNPGFVKTPLTDRNSFEMPYLVSAEEAAREIWQGLHADCFEIAFPRPFVRRMKLLKHLPYRLFFPAIRKATGVR